jgi:hypothetical protein
MWRINLRTDLSSGGVPANPALRAIINDAFCASLRCPGRAAFFNPDRPCFVLAVFHRQTEVVLAPTRLATSDRFNPRSSRCAAFKRRASRVDRSVLGIPPPTGSICVSRFRFRLRAILSTIHSATAVRYLAVLPDDDGVGLWTCIRCLRSHCGSPGFKKSHNRDKKPQLTH